MKKPLILLMIMALMLTSTAGCSPKKQQVQQGKTVKDSLGREITLEKPLQKIISVAPAITEILFALGLEKEIIGVSDYCDYPEQAMTKEKMGSFKNPNVEIIASKQPDMVFMSAGVQEDVMRKLEELNVKVVVLDADTIKQVINNITLAGLLTDKEAKALEITTDMKNRMTAVTSKVKDLPKPKVFFEVWDEPLMSAGSTSFIHNIIETAGGSNVAADSSKRYYTFSAEKLLEINPDVYFINTHSHTPEDIKDRNGYEALSAVQNDKVFTIEDNLISRAGPRVIEGLEQTARILHPEAFNK